MATSTSTPSSDPTESVRFCFEIPGWADWRQIVETVWIGYSFPEWSVWQPYDRDVTVLEGLGDREHMSLLGVLAERAWNRHNHGAYARGRVEA